jgi:pimeloyl-ACP methyl ester carboxylesterase
MGPGYLVSARGPGGVCQHRCWERFLAVLAAVLLAGCSSPVARRAEQVPPPSVSARLPIILLPGISRETVQVMRGGTLGPFGRLALPTDDGALARLDNPRFPEDGEAASTLPATLDRALRETDVRGLQPLIDRLVAEEGYLRGNPEDPRDKDYRENPLDERLDRTRIASLFVLYYDWRRDLAESACVVADRIARIRAATGAPQVLLVGYSLGGVLARYYLRYGGRDAVGGRECPLGDGTSAFTVNRPGADWVRRAALFGAPNRGSILAFRALEEDFRLFGFLALGVRAAAFSMPITWQLLPSAGSDGRVPLLVGQDGAEPVALYDLRTWTERGWLPGDHDNAQGVRFAGAMLTRAAAIERSLSDRNSAEDGVPRLAVGSDCQPTPVRALAVHGKLRFLSFREFDDPLFDQVTAPGDGVVTAESALGLPASATLTTLTTCSRHGAYLIDADTRARAVQFLLQ